MKLVLSIRGTWQDLEARANTALDAPASAPPQFAAAMQQERSAFSWSA